MTLAALLRECVENPDDDASRLVLADWLDDHGDAERAEFVRAQVTLSRMDEYDPRRRDLEERERQLREAHESRWMGRLSEWCGLHYAFERGLLRVTLGAWMAEADPEAEEWGWVGEARFQVTAAELADLGDWPLRAGLVAADLSDCGLKLAGARVLADCRWLSGLRSLNLSKNHIGNKGAVLLAASPFAANLRSLDLGGNQLGLEGIQALAGSPHLAGLESLDLEWNSAYFVGLAALLTSPRLAGLKALNLSRNCHGTQKGFGPMPPCPHPPILTRLNLRANHLNPPRVASLVASPALSRLTHLDLSENQVRPEGARAVAASPHLANLTSLELYASFPGDEGLLALLRSPYLTRLEELDVGAWYPVGPPVTRAGIEALVAWPGLARLRRLGLNLDAAGAAALAGSPHVAGLRCLTVHPGRAGDEAAAALAASPHLGGLWSLRMEQNGIGDAGAAAALRQRFGDRVHL